MSEVGNRVGEEDQSRVQTDSMMKRGTDRGRRTARPRPTVKMEPRWSLPGTRKGQPDQTRPARAGEIERASLAPSPSLQEACG